MRKQRGQKLGKLTTNTVAEPPAIAKRQFEHITFNMTPSIRHEVLEGRQYQVVPMVMITEGVHNGSNGPLYYPADELAKTPALWDHKPIVVNHPTQNGESISACTPQVVNSRKVGLIMNTRYIPAKNGQPGKLRSEAWLETNRLGEIDPRIAAAVKNGEMVEVSTGLYTDNEQAEGMWKKERYEAIARNYRADHLAILPDEKGSCSLADGAGLMRNSAGDAGTFMPIVVNGVDYLQRYTRNKTGKLVLLGEPVPNQKTGAVMNRKQAIDSLINNSSMWDESDRPYLTGVPMDKLHIFVTNAAVVRKENGQDVIGADDDDNSEGLDQSGIAPSVDGKKKGKKPKEEDPEDVVADAKKGMSKNSAAKEVTFEELLSRAKPDVAGMITNGLRQYNAAKNKLIGQICANANNSFTKEFLGLKDLEELEGLASLAAAPATTNKGAGGVQMRIANYAGQGEPGGFVENAEDAEEPLDIPTLNFERRSATAAQA